MMNAKTIFWYESEMEEEKNQTIYCLFTGAPQPHHFNTGSSVYSLVMALIPCYMVGVSTLKGQSLCVSLETPSSWIKL